MSNERLEKLFSFQEANPNDPFVIYAIASEYVKQNDTKQALRYFRKLVNNHPGYVGTYYHFGKLYESLQQKEKAIEIYQKGMAVAKQANNLHALAELQSVHDSLLGIEPDDEDW
ncbi:tetratricopeptide repeat protein [Olivibacter sp. SDN3]|uniref:tetratricopeptide repeat protein n=1 Tax=Olivibacter sp. SDN3 TaxID=2764720 RepID=UPI001651AC20|nr:tetratricopeptide repeat protein [Olivibacter sp. SDN3]QNL48983.1 tetratricopeptide repeat protein [Olivibacter sp. SDN3]